MTAVECAAQRAGLRACQALMLHGQWRHYRCCACCRLHRQRRWRGSHVPHYVVAAMPFAQDKRTVPWAAHRQQCWNSSESGATSRTLMATMLVLKSHPPYGARRRPQPHRRCGGPYLACPAAEPPAGCCCRRQAACWCRCGRAASRSAAVCVPRVASACQAASGGPRRRASCAMRGQRRGEEATAAAAAGCLRSCCRLGAAAPVTTALIP